MNTDLDSLFHQFFESIRLDEDYVKTMRVRRSVIVKAINRKFRDSETDEHYLHVGSYGRHTAAKGSDFDIAVILPDLYRLRFTLHATNGPSHLLQVVKEAICISYPKTDIHGDGQVVKIQFSDGQKFEILPAFEMDYPRGMLTYPDSHDDGKWMTTDPRSEKDAISDLNSSCNNKLYDLCRAVRIWNRNKKVGMSGYAIDASVCEFSQKCPSPYYQDISHLIAGYFQYISEKTFYQSWRMIGSGNNVATIDYRNDVKITLFDIQRAISLASCGMVKESAKVWRSVFGTDFPIE